MIAKVDTSYMIICPIDTPEDVIYDVACQVEVSIRQEFYLKEMGIDLDKLTSGLE